MTLRGDSSQCMEEAAAVKIVIFSEEVSRILSTDTVGLVDVLNP